MSKEYKIWNGLIINDSQIITGVTDDSGLTNNSNQLATTNAVKGFIENQIGGKLNISGGTLTGPLSGTTLVLSNKLYVTGLTSNVTDKIMYYDTISKELSYGDMGSNSQWTNSGTSIFYSGGSVTIGTNLIYNELLTLRKDSASIGASMFLINDNYLSGNAETEILFSTRLDVGGVSRYRYSKIHTTSTGTYGIVDKLSIGMTYNGSDYKDVLNISYNVVGISGDTSMTGNLYVSGMTNDDTQPNMIYYNTSDGKLTYGLKPSQSYSAITYNVTGGTEIIATGSPVTYTIDFTTIDVYSVNITGGTQNNIVFDFSNPKVGKTLTIIITNNGISNFTNCIFSATTCKTFGFYDSTKTNAVSVLCISTSVNPKYWVVIANT